MAATESLPSIAPFRLRNKESKYPHNYDSTETPNRKHAPSWGCQFPSLLPSFVALGPRRIRSGPCEALESRRDSGTIWAATIINLVSQHRVFPNPGVGPCAGTTHAQQMDAWLTKPHQQCEIVLTLVDMRARAEAGEPKGKI